MASPYWIEQLPDGTYKIWTKTSIAANSSTVLYLRKTDGYNPDGSQVFEFFDDFTSDTLANYVVNGGSYSISDGKLYITGISAGNAVIAPSTQNLPDSYVVEMKGSYSDLGSSTDSWLGVLGYQSSIAGTDGYCCQFGSGRLDIEKYKVAHLSTTTITESQNTMCKIKGTFASGNIIATFEDTTSVSTTDTSFTSGYFGIRTFDADAEVDYIFVRKYTEQEPTVSVEQISTDTWKITISNPNDYDLVDFQVGFDGTGIVGSNADSLLIDINPPYEVKYIYIMNTKTVDESGILYDSFPAGYGAPPKQLVDADGNIYDYYTENGKIYIDIPETNPILAQTLKTLSFNDVDYTQATLDTSLAKFMDMIFSDVVVAVGGGDSSQILQHSISMDLSTKFIKSTVVLEDGTTDFAYYDFSSEYDEIQQLVDVSTQSSFVDNLITFTATLTNGKTATTEIPFNEQTIINLYNSIRANKYDTFKIRQNGTEYSFLVESRQDTPTPNIAYSPATDGTPVYEQLGAPENRWSFTLYVDSIPKYQFLRQLASNPIAEVYFEEIGEWKTALIQTISQNRITTGHYYADVELVIL